MRALFSLARVLHYVRYNRYTADADGGSGGGVASSGGMTSVEVASPGGMSTWEEGSSRVKSSRVESSGMSMWEEGLDELRALGERSSIYAPFVFSYRHVASNPTPSPCALLRDLRSNPMPSPCAAERPAIEPNAFPMRC
jgi:hypothetical protein